MARSMSASYAEISEYERERMIIPDVSFTDIMSPARNRAEAANAYPDLFQ